MTTPTSLRNRSRLRRSPRSIGQTALAGIAALCLFAPSASSAPEVDLHDLLWRVHVDLINPLAGEDLAYWQAVLDTALVSSNSLLEGQQGPIDRPCCTRLASSVTLATFGTSGDGLDVIDSPADQSAIAALALGSSAFLVDSATYCSGPSIGAIGCAMRPGCTNNPNDDPNLWMFVTVDALDDGTLASVIAHERGHNSCLGHVTGAPCQLMQGTVLTPGLAACLNETECATYQNARTEISSGITCSCHDDALGLLADGAICSEVVGGVCSGGLCGEIAGDAGVHLLTAADPGDLSGPPEDAIRVSALSGDWTNLTQISPTSDDIRAMAYATDSGTLYAIVPTVFDDSVVTLDPSSGMLVSVVGAIANGAEEIVSMAYDPGPTSAPGDDRLIVLEVDGTSGQFRWIDPASPSTANLIGGLGLGPAATFSGMAYDSLQRRLFLASRFDPTGFYEVDLAGCSPANCPTTALTSWDVRAWDNASLGFSAESGMLYLIGNLTYQPSGVTTTFYAVIDPTTGLSSDVISLDRFTPAALATVPEPGWVTGITAGLFALALTARRRRNHSA